MIGAQPLVHIYIFIRMKVLQGEYGRRTKRLLPAKYAAKNSTLPAVSIIAGQFVTCPSALGQFKSNRMSVVSVCLFIPKDIANRLTNMVLLLL